MQTGTHWPPDHPPTPLAVLLSGGLDSAVLLAEASLAYPLVQPIYVRVGSIWEEIELDRCRRFLARLNSPRAAALKILDLPVGDLYGRHWSLTGDGVPDEHSPDEAVYLPGRNVILLAKALLHCHLQGIPEIALALLGSNPFPDATPAFFDALSRAVNLGVGGNVRVLTPYADLPKEEIIRRGRRFPLAESFSCIRPVRGRHCGHCNKCAERQKAFRLAGVEDPTDYTG